MGDEPLSERWTFDPVIASRAQFSEVALGLLADHAATTDPQHSSGRTVWAEIKRREVVAQIRAAEATEQAAAQSKISAFWMMWSVMVAAAATILAAAFAAANFVLNYGACHS